MMQADLALYGAKDEGRDCFRFHSHDLDREVHERVRVAEELQGRIGPAASSSSTTSRRSSSPPGASSGSRR